MATLVRLANNMDLAQTLALRCDKLPVLSMRDARMAKLAKIIETRNIQTITNRDRIIVLLGVIFFYRECSRKSQSEMGLT